jgi:carboxypeptidase Taq
VDADEATYPAHVILRYRLEKAMIAGDLNVIDLPGAWNDGMKELLGIVPDSDRDGCMQDVHWPGGDFGYFPTYTLGAIIAAQFFATAKAALPDLADSVRKGDFLPLISWLKDHIHSYGSYYSANELLVKSTGRAIDVENYKQHLRNRYLG